MIVIDGNYIAHMVFHTKMGELRNGVIYGALRQIGPLKRQFPDHPIVWCFDSSASKRRALLKSYKQQRRDADAVQRVENPQAAAIKNDLYRQLNELKHVLRTVGGCCVLGGDDNWAGYEGDDLIAAVCQKYDDCIIVSSDEDLYQLLDGLRKIRIWKPKSKTEYTEIDFMLEYDMLPKEWVEVKALAGCNSDNVKGIPGVGVKTALKIITGTKKFPEEHRELVELNRRLVTLPFDDINVNVFVKPFDPAEWNRQCMEYQMPSLKIKK